MSKHPVLTKADLIYAIHLQLGFSKKEASTILETFFEIFKEILLQGEAIQISGFGHFEIKQKQPRIGRNVCTGDNVLILARKILSFKASKILKQMLNSRP